MIDLSWSCIDFDSHPRFLLMASLDGDITPFLVDQTAYRRLEVAVKCRDIL
jgi:hypothetical protein